MNRQSIHWIGGLLATLLLGGPALAEQSGTETADPYPLSIEPVEEGESETEQETPYPLSIEPVEEKTPGEKAEAYPVSIMPAEQDPEYQNFSDLPMLRNITYPDWFENTFLDLRDDLETALEEGKKGIILYFGHKHCAYCEAMLRVNFERPDIAGYIRKHFNVIPIDTWGHLEVTTLDGEVMSEKEYSDREEVHYTPYLIFYGENGEQALRMKGYYPPYIFQAALDFVISGTYRQDRDFQNYLNRSQVAPELGGVGELHSSPLFTSPPYYLARNARRSAQRPLVVIFEQEKCHACDIFHNELLSDPVIYNKFDQMEVVRLNVKADTPVVTPAGRATTARRWADRLDLFYTPSMLFFNRQGREVLRVDSVIRLFLLNHVLDYVLKEGYQREDIFHRWVSSRLHVEGEMEEQKDHEG